MSCTHKKYYEVDCIVGEDDSIVIDVCDECGEDLGVVEECHCIDNCVC